MSAPAQSLLVPCGECYSIHRIERAHDGRATLTILEWYMRRVARPLCEREDDDLVPECRTWTLTHRGEAGWCKPECDERTQEDDDSAVCVWADESEQAHALLRACKAGECIEP